MAPSDQHAIIQLAGVTRELFLSLGLNVDLHNSKQAKPDAAEAAE